MAPIRPSAVRVWASWRRRLRAFMVSATMSRSSARLPPTSRWMPMADDHPFEVLALHPLGHLVEGARRAGDPRRASATTWRISLPMGSDSWTATVSSPCRMEKPERSVVPSSCSMSGSWARRPAVRGAWPGSPTMTHGTNGQGGQDPEAPDELPSNEAEEAAEDGGHEIEEQRLGRPDGQVGLIELAFNSGQQPPTGGSLGHRVDGPLEEGRLDELGRRRDCGRRRVESARVAHRVRGEGLLELPASAPA